MQYFVYKNLVNIQDVEMVYKNYQVCLIYPKNFMNIKYNFTILDGETMKLQM